MNETFYEVLHVYKKPNTTIEGVELVKSMMKALVRH